MTIELIISACIGFSMLCVVWIIFWSLWPRAYSDDDVIETNDEWRAGR